MPGHFTAGFEDPEAAGVPGYWRRPRRGVRLSRVTASPRTATTDVLVIGGGPAGSVAARLLATWGHDVTVLTRRAAGDRALAESIPPSGVQLLERVGVRSAVDAAGFVRATGNTVRWGADAPERVEMFPPGTHGYQVDRARLDAVLLRAAEDAGASVRGAATALRVEAADGGRRVTFGDGDATTLEASWVLDCSGRAGVTARHGWRVPESAARTIAIASVWERSGPWPCPDPTHTIVESFAGGWGWSVPVSTTRRFVTLMLDPAITALGAREQLAHTFRAQLGRTQTLRALVSGATQAGAPFARDASPYHARRYADRGLMLVGDAGSFVDPLSSFGIKKALASAWLAAVVVRSAIAQPAITDAALALFDARERGMSDALARRASDLARDATAPTDGGFWSARAGAANAAADAATDATEDVVALEPDVAALRADPDVLRSLDALRQRDALRLRASPSARRERRPTVRGNRVVTEEHLVVPAFPQGIRYVRNVDLVRLADLAPAHAQVPELFAAYNRQAPPCALPDFLGALALLIGKGALVLA